VSEPRWLDDDQQRAWRAYLTGVSRLTERLDRDLREGFGISLPEYEILTRLSEAPCRRIRMAELAASVNQSRSRLSHTIARLEQHGLVAREGCPGDRRGVFAVLTDAGFALLERAARVHVRGVRAYFVDVVSPEDFAAIGRAFAQVAEVLQP